MKKLFSYMGSKSRYLKEINEIINKTTATTYIEPFVGSGVVFLNLEKQFDKYLLFDKYDDLLSFYRLGVSPSTFDKRVDNIISYANSLDLENDRDAFMNFRDNDYALETDPLNRAVKFFIVMSLTMNSMPSFNKDGNLKNGYGGSFFGKYPGHKYSTGVESLKEAYVYICEKNIKTKLGFDYKEREGFYFIDPPYFKRNMRTGWSEKDTEKLIDWLISINQPYLYTDMESSYTDKLIKAGGTPIYFNKIRNISPNVKKYREKGGTELKHREVFIYKL